MMPRMRACFEIYVCVAFGREKKKKKKNIYQKRFLTCDALVQSPSLERVCLRAKKRAKKRHECVENDKKNYVNATRLIIETKKSFIHFALKKTARRALPTICIRDERIFFLCVFALLLLTLLSSAIFSLARSRSRLGRFGILIQ